MTATAEIVVQTEHKGPQNGTVFTNAQSHGKLFSEKHIFTSDRMESAFNKFSAALRNIETRFEEKKLPYGEAVRLLGFEACRAISAEFDLRARFNLLSAPEGRLALRFVCADEEGLECPDIRWTASRDKHEAQLCLEKNMIFYYPTLSGSLSIGTVSPYKKASDITVENDRIELGWSLGRDNEIASVPIATDTERLGVLIIDRNHNPSVPLTENVIEFVPEDLLDPYHKRPDFKEFVVAFRTSLHSIRSLNRQMETRKGKQEIINFMRGIHDRQKEIAGRISNIAKTLPYHSDEITKLASESMLLSEMALNASLNGELRLHKIPYRDLFSKAVSLARADSLPQGIEVSVGSAITLGTAFHGDVPAIADAISAVISEAAAHASEKIEIALTAYLDKTHVRHLMFHFIIDGKIGMQQAFGTELPDSLLAARQAIEENGGHIYSNPGEAGAFYVEFPSVSAARAAN